MTFERYQPRPIRPPLPQDWGFAIPTLCDRKSRENECIDKNSLYGRHIGLFFFLGGGGVVSVGIVRDQPNFLATPYYLRNG